jgi:GT2 family glycosyltransferase
MEKYPVSIILPVYKNYSVFYKSLGNNIKYFNGCEVIIMNDDPQENITLQVKKVLPTAVVINNKENLGFSGNVNRGIKKATRDFVFIINSDVVLKDDSFLTVLSRFKLDSKLFAVGLAQIEKDGKTVGANRGYYKDGLINHGSILPVPTSPHANFWAEGGASIFNRKLFIGLGMLDELYNPFYWEDVDLSYRAWKAGYRILFDPAACVEHHHETTIGKYFEKYQVTRIAFRNQLIFQWKNLTDKNLILKQLANIPRFIFIPGFFDALIKLPKILQSRKKTIKLFVRSDKEILENFK